METETTTKKRKAESMSFSVPVGFRFNPTDVELLTHYLSGMLRSETPPHGLIHHASVYAFHPQKLTETYAAATETDWYFFTPREPKYPKGSRPDRRAGNGYWKATGSFQTITHRGRVVGHKRSLVFHQLQGDSNHRHATKTNWIMHEYVSAEQHLRDGGPSKVASGFDSRVLCRIRYHGKRPSQPDSSDSFSSRGCEAKEVINPCDHGTADTHLFSNVSLPNPNTALDLTCPWLRSCEESVCLEYTGCDDHTTQTEEVIKPCDHGTTDTHLFSNVSLPKPNTSSGLTCPFLRRSCEEPDCLVHRFLDTDTDTDFCDLLCDLDY